MTRITDEDGEGGFVVVSTDRPALLDEISTSADAVAEVFWPINCTIHDNPELGYKEVIAHAALTKFMRAQPGWKVTPSAYGYATAWVAVYDSGKRGPVVSFNAEMGKSLSQPETR